MYSSPAGIALRIFQCLLEAYLTGENLEFEEIKIEIIIIDVFGTLTDRMERRIKIIGIDCPVELLQNGRLIYTARIIGKVMSLSKWYKNCTADCRRRCMHYLPDII